MSEPEGESVMIVASWNSGPYGTFSQSDATEEKPDRIGGYGTHTVLVPRETYERYAKAEQELLASEAALESAVNAAVERLRS